MYVARTLIDIGCATYRFVSSQFVSKNNLKRIPIDARTVKGFNGSKEEVKVVRTFTDIGGYHRRIFLYVVKSLSGYDMILGRPWMDDNSAVSDAKDAALLLKEVNMRVSGSGTR